MLLWQSWQVPFPEEAVSSGFFKSSGTNSRSCFPLDVRRISFPFFSNRKEWNNFSMISALVATVPSPPVSPRVFFHLIIIRRHITYRILHGGQKCRFCKKRAGALVLPLVIFVRVTVRVSPLWRTGSACSEAFKYISLLLEIFSKIFRIFIIPVSIIL